MSEDPVTHALAYPFELPDASYVLDDNGARSIQSLPDLSRCHGVLACGSNQSPDQLQHKFAGRGLGAVFVLEAWIDGLDAAYSAHYARYGSLPATPVGAAGTRARFFVTWLTDAQLSRMHETEALGQNYVYGRIDTVAIRHFGVPVADSVCSYTKER